MFVLKKNAILRTKTNKKKRNNYESKNDLFSNADDEHVHHVGM